MGRELAQALAPAPSDAFPPASAAPAVPPMLLSLRQLNIIVLVLVVFLVLFLVAISVLRARHTWLQRRRMQAAAELAASQQSASLPRGSNRAPRGRGRRRNTGNRPRGFRRDEIEQLGTCIALSGGEGVGTDDAAAEDGRKECVVCLVEYSAEDKLRQLHACGHSFHQGCVDAWLRRHKTCPLCRTELHCLRKEDAQAGAVAVEEQMEGPGEEQEGQAGVAQEQEWQQVVAPQEPGAQVLSHSTAEIDTELADWGARNVGPAEGDAGNRDLREESDDPTGEMPHLQEVPPDGNSAHAGVGRGALPPLAVAPTGVGSTRLAPTDATGSNRGMEDVQGQSSDRESSQIKEGTVDDGACTPKNVPSL